MAPKRLCFKCGAEVTYDDKKCPVCGGVAFLFDYGESHNDQSKHVVHKETSRNATSLEKIYSSQVSKEHNEVGKVLRYIAWAVYILGFIGGIFIGYSENGFKFSVAIVYWITAFISGTMFLGFSEIINLLQALVDKK